MGKLVRIMFANVESVADVICVRVFFFQAEDGIRDC